MSATHRMTKELAPRARFEVLMERGKPTSLLLFTFQRLLSSAVDPACDSGKKTEGCASAGRPASTANPLKPHKSSSRVGVCRTAQLLYRRGGFSRQSSAVARQKGCRSVSIRQPVVRSPLTEDELRSVEQLYREIG